MLYYDGRAGFLTTIIGPMFSEKSGELIKRCKLSQQYQNKRVVVYKPGIDNRYASNEVVSRIGLRMPALQLNPDLAEEDLEEKIFSPCRDADMVGFDEAQFFSPELVGVVERLLQEKKHVLVAGLNLDYLGRPFGSIDKLLLFSDEIVVKNAFCKCCGRPAMYTQRVIGRKPVTQANLDSELVLIGDTESYEARCRLCFQK